MSKEYNIDIYLKSIIDKYENGLEYKEDLQNIDKDMDNIYDMYRETLIDSDNLICALRVFKDLYTSRIEDILSKNISLDDKKNFFNEAVIWFNSLESDIEDFDQELEYNAIGSPC